MVKAMKFFGKGLAFPIAEHEAIKAWAERPNEEWLRIEMVLRFPDTPELLGVTEPGTKTPSFLMWRTEASVIVYPFFTARYVGVYASILDALDALGSWWIGRRAGEEHPLRMAGPHSGAS